MPRAHGVADRTADYASREPESRRRLMANYYTKFSDVLPNLTADEEAWLREQMEGDPEGDEGRGSGPECDHEFLDDDRPDRWGRHLWLYTAESGDPDAVAKFVQQFLKRFRPGQCWSMTFAYTCSSPGVGDFGGGAVFVAANSIETVDTDYIADQQQREFAGRQADTTDETESEQDGGGEATDR
jgi:hypothetical protein